MAGYKLTPGFYLQHVFFAVTVALPQVMAASHPTLHFSGITLMVIALYKQSLMGGFKITQHLLLFEKHHLILSLVQMDQMLELCCC